MNFGRETIEFIAPTGPGPIQDYIDKYREQIRGITFHVKSLDKVREHLKASNIPAVDGDAPDTVAIPPEHNYSVLYQFSE
jgi:hypothetical protein